KGGALTTDGAGTIYAFVGGNQSFHGYDIASNTWSSRANTGTNTGEGAALQFLNVGGTDYVYALMGNGNSFRRWTVGHPRTRPTLTNTPNSVKKGGALTTDGTNIYALNGAGQNPLWAYNVVGTWRRAAGTR